MKPGSMPPWTLNVFLFPLPSRAFSDPLHQPPRSPWPQGEAAGFSAQREPRLCLPDKDGEILATLSQHLFWGWAVAFYMIFNFSLVN